MEGLTALPQAVATSPSELSLILSRATTIAIMSMRRMTVATTAATNVIASVSAAHARSFHDGRDSKAKECRKAINANPQALHQSQQIAFLICNACHTYGVQYQHGRDCARDVINNPFRMPTYTKSGQVEKAKERKVPTYSAPATTLSIVYPRCGLEH